MQFGAHMSIAGGMFNALTRAVTATCDTIQVFNKSNSQWKAKILSDKEVQQWFDAIDETGISVACSHSSYLINIASPKDDLSDKSRNSLIEEMQRCERLKIPNLVMHPGSHVGSGEEVGMDRIAENINKMYDEMGDSNQVTLALEATAGQGTNLGYKFEQLAYIIDKVEAKEKMGICLDSCHIFAAGYPLIDPKEYKKTMKSFDDIIGLDRLKIFHINDSKKEFGSKRDRHEHLGEGFLGLEAFRNIVNDKRLKKVPMILETPKEDDMLDDIKNLKILRGLVKTG